MTEEIRKHTPKDGPRVRGGSPEARKVAALVFGVLAGEQRPSEAAQALGIGLPRYYILERRALEGLVAACQPAVKGRRSAGPEQELEEKARQIKRLEQDVARYQALARAAQRAVGLTSVKKPPEKGKRKRRSPVVRALKVARSLQAETPPVAAVVGAENA
jgi:hypothetical protein